MKRICGISCPNNSTTINLIVLQGLAMIIVKEFWLDIHQFKKVYPGRHIGEIVGNVKKNIVYIAGSFHMGCLAFETSDP